MRLPAETPVTPEDPEGTWSRKSTKSALADYSPLLSSDRRGTYGKETRAALETTYTPCFGLEEF
jgi:hypothetical protein